MEVPPGTEVEKRNRRGDPGRTPADTVARMHDIQYGLAQNAPNKKEQARLVRAADNRMINSLKSIQRGAHGGDAFRNIQAGLRGIQAKTIGEDLGLLDKQKFSGPLKKLPTRDTVLLANEEKKMEQMGYGLPGDELKMKLLRNMKKKKIGPVSARARHRGKAAGAGQGGRRPQGGRRGFTPSGKGINIPGGMIMGMGDIKTFVVKSIVPKLIKDLGIKPRALSIGKISPLVSKVLELARKKTKSGPTGTLSAIIKNLTKVLLPFLTQAKLKTLGIQMTGSGVMDILGKARVGLEKKLASGLLKVFKIYINKTAASQGVNKPFKGSGINLPGGGSWGQFFRGFKKGFLTIMRPGAKILGGIATATGQPEIGIPLTMASKLL